jgi:hypothetical protein
MQFKVGSFLAFIDRHGFIRIGGCGFNYDSAAAPVKAAVKKAVDANPWHPDAPGINHVIITNEEKS